MSIRTDLLTSTMMSGVGSPTWFEDYEEVVRLGGMDAVWEFAKIDLSPTHALTVYRAWRDRNGGASFHSFLLHFYTAEYYLPVH